MMLSTKPSFKSQVMLNRMYGQGSSSVNSKESPSKKASIKLTGNNLTIEPNDRLQKKLILEASKPIRPFSNKSQRQRNPGENMTDNKKVKQVVQLAKSPSQRVYQKVSQIQRNRTPVRRVQSAYRQNVVPNLHGYRTI